MNLFSSTEPQDELDPFENIGQPYVITKSIEDRLSEGSAIHRAEDLLEEYGRQEKVKTAKFTKDSNQFKRSIKLLNGMFAGALWQRTEWYVTFNGVQIKRDLFGFMDIMGMRPHPDYPEACQVIGVQLTTLNQVAPHIRKYVSDAKSQDEVPTEQKLRHFLKCGNIAVILGYHKPKAFWECQVTELTEPLLDAAIKRKRK